MLAGHGACVVRDLRRARLRRVLSIHMRRGLMNVLAGSVTEEKKKLNKVYILFSLRTKSVLVAS